MIRRIVCEPHRAAVTHKRGRIAQEKTHHLGRSQIFDDGPHPRIGASIQERCRGWSESILIALFFEMSAHGEIVAKDADASNCRTSRRRERIGRIIALSNL